VTAAALGASATAPRFRLAGWRAVLAIWLGLALALVAFAWPMIAELRATDPDDYMRLLEVRDWLAGQGWFDVRQYRMDAPLGADMHWSRLVDLPIGVALWIARLFVAEPAASAAAMTVVPLLQLLAAMLLLHRLLRVLGQSEPTALAAASIVLLFPVLTTNFMPLRIDHHGWQAVCALACALALRQPGVKGAAMAGAAAALWLTISLEGLVLVLALAGLMALRQWRHGEAAIAPFCGALAVTAVGLAFVTRPFGQFAHATADQLSWPHVFAFASAGAVAVLAGRHRVAGPVLAGLAGAAAILAGLGSAALDPFHALDPVVRHMWLENVTEGMPVTRQDWSTRAMLLYTPCLVLAGWRIALRSDDGTHTRDWNELALFALIACSLSLVLMRGAVAAQLLAVPFSAVLLSRLFPKAKALRTAPARVAAMAACLTLLTPSLASAAGRWIDHAAAANAPVTASKPLANGFGICDLGSLAAIPPARLFAFLDFGPEILVRTGHSVVAGSYHRNNTKMREVIEVFSGDPARAQPLVSANRSQFLVFCASDDEARIDAGRRPDNLASQLLAGRPPQWLVPVPGFTGGLQVYRVKPR